MKTRKTILAILMAGVMGLSLAACGGGNAGSSASSDAGEAASSVQEAASEAASSAEEATSAVEDTAEGTEETAGEAASGEAIYDGSGNVYFAIPNSSITRWPKFDAPMIEKWLKVYAPNMTFSVLDAQGDSQKQLQQIESSITSGMDFLIYAPADENSAAGALAALNDEGVPFCALAHTPYGGECKMMVTMPFPSIAQSYLDYMETNILPNADGPVKVACIWGAQGAAFYEELTATYHETLDKWVDEGKVEIVYEADTNDWTAASSAPVAEQMMTNTGGDIDVIITMNDDLMTGIVSVLKDQGELGNAVLLGGCDATVEGLARVQEGLQAADAIPDYDAQAEAVAKICATWLANGEAPVDMADRNYDNGSSEGIEQVLVPNVLVTADNIQEEIIDKGVATADEIEAVAKTMR